MVMSRAVKFRFGINLCFECNTWRYDKGKIHQNGAHIVVAEQ